MDVAGLIARVKPVTEKHMRLTDAIGSLLEDFNMVCSSYEPQGLHISCLHACPQHTRVVLFSLLVVCGCIHFLLSLLTRLFGCFRCAYGHEKVSYVPLDASDPDSVSLVLSQIDHSIQYGEDVEPAEPENLDVD